MTFTTATAPGCSWTINWTRRAYREFHWKSGEEPRKRRLSVVAHSARSQWHVTVTFEGSLHSDRVARARVEKRLQDLEDLCLCLDFDRLQLLDNTVTELVIRHERDDTPPFHTRYDAVTDRILPLRASPRPDSEYAPAVPHLRLCLREDPFRVWFPPYDGSAGTPTKHLSVIHKIRELGVGVYEAHVELDDKSYVYKEVDIPLYMPGDGQALGQELRNLERFCGTDGIARLVAVVVSKNPYQTAQIDQPDKTVVWGILLEYHPNGTLLDALQNAQNALQPKTVWPWQKWALQISRALECLHQGGVTHMDLKPSNVVITADNNAVLVDISGIGGTTHEWLAPELRDMPEPLSANLESRIRNDIWALGSMLSLIANVSGTMEKQLKCVAERATAEDPFSRTTLHDIISTLSSLSS